MTSFVIAQYNSVPKLSTLNSNKIINPVSGSNPVDLGTVNLPNVRGQVSISIISGDNGFMSSFDVIGGFGEYYTQWSQNWYPQTASELNCTVKVPQVNRMEVITPLIDAGGRVYVLQFFPIQSYGPTIRQVSVNIIGNNTLSVRLVKRLNVQGW